MKIKKAIGVAALLLATSLTLIGCDNVGNAVEGSADAAKKEFDGMPPEKQIEQLNYAPIPPAEKEKRIQEIEKKYGIKRPDPAGAKPDAGARGQ